ncbi:NtaA/DmoA family FMN-dependent monooxygenase [Microbacterium sp. SORGH_AS_0888]|uniref:NtaA/DmoA family FMN-dependent monooxygenase n=1 Tax=Microbacterium sp. SORGH_AS_0888 TaxID=3041791 RepID=UPI002785E560|nr:NtaA/DmoA family FMN-dependent monooxygenase [Microbacterium sp. SORGH_AS_0888]MDQ1128268.1 FMN-dependent oxidoreductase (nitrilotriacetate monooxygenase family) [Microbacterium sp. SORGH_AS_0888]
MSTSVSSSPGRPLHFAAFVQNTPGHVVHGTWRRLTGRQADANDLRLWVELARTLERGTFDAIFFADIIGLYNAHKGGTRKFIQSGVGIPANDPAALVSALAYATEHLGIAYTSSILQEHPFSFARRISTLDHLTQGRVAWNIVTNTLSNAARNFGYDDLTEHDERYRWADEYVDVVYKLWEGSWEDDALVIDRENGVFNDPDKVHRINHEGPRYRVEGPHLVSPSPQRSPFLFQAGASPAGRDFAARNAEAVFLTSANVETIAEDAADFRRRAAAYGRDGSDIKLFQGLQFVVASTDEEARRKAAEIDEWIDGEAQLAQMGGVAGVDFGDFELDSPIGEVKAEGMQSIIDWVNAGTKGREATVGDLGRFPRDRKPPGRVARDHRRSARPMARRGRGRHPRDEQRDPGHLQRLRGLSHPRAARARAGPEGVRAGNVAAEAVRSRPPAGDPSGRRIPRRLRRGPGRRLTSTAEQKRRTRHVHT